MRRAALLALVCLLGSAAQAGAVTSVPVTRGQVAAMTLPREALGAVAETFSIELPSGFTDNRRAARDSYDPADSAASLAKAGRKYGFALLYGDPALDALRTGKGAIDIGTSVDVFGTARQARLHSSKTLADLTEVRGRNLDGVVLEEHETFRVRGIGHQAVGIRTRIRLGTTFVYGTYVDFRFGRFVAEAALTRGDDADVTDEALRIARALDRRIRDVLSRRIPGVAPRVPRPAAPGRLPGAPDLASMVLALEEVPEGAKVSSERYVNSDNALSAYNRDFQYQGQAAMRTGLLAIRSDASLLRSSTEAGGQMLVLRTIFAAPNAAETVAGSFTLGTGLPTGSASVDQLRRSLGVGDESFAASVSFATPAGRVRMVLFYLRVGKVLATITVTGAAPAFAIEPLMTSARAAARRVARGLSRLIA